MRGHNSMRCWASCASIIALSAATIVEIGSPPTPRLIYNRSESAAFGWYAVSTTNEFQKGDLVAAYPPRHAGELAVEREYLGEGIPLIKTIWAAPGGTVCSEGGVVITQDRPIIYAAKTDSAGRVMPSWQGCMTLNEDQFFLVSTRIENSFDSRYFGPVSRKNILGRAYSFGNFLKTGEESAPAQGRARGER